jgi:hypothetical protein
MINLKLSILNPWQDRFENVYAAAGKTPFKHKYWEVQLIKSNDLVTVDLRISHKTDHAGVDLWLGLLGYSVNLNFYDNRHWNYETNKWEVYDESQ